MLPNRRTGAAFKYTAAGLALVVALVLILRPVVTDYSILNPIGFMTWTAGVMLMLFLLLQVLKTPSTPE